jgi:hypothetical protein
MVYLKVHRSWWKGWALAGLTGVLSGFGLICVLLTLIAK